MTDADRPQHLFIKLPDETKADTSARLAEEFCKAYSRLFSVTARVVAVEPVVCEAVVEIDGTHVAIEFTGYHQRDEFQELERADCSAREALSRALQETDLPPFGIHITWGTEPRRKRLYGASERRSLVPGGGTLGEVVQDLLKIARLVSEQSQLDGKRLIFHESAVRPDHWPRGHAVLRPTSFPAAAARISKVTFSRWTRPHIRPSIRTSFDARSVGVDQAHLTTVVEGKLAKLRRYREATQKDPVWLVIHSDGIPMSTRISPPLLEEAIATVRAILHTKACRFDATWWAENTGFVDATDLYRIDPPIEK